MSTADFDRYYANLSDRLDRIAATKPQAYGGDASIAGLRCFIRYHKDARQDVQINGRTRSLTHKQVRMHGLMARLAVSGDFATITALAGEALVAPSTLSRFILKLQAWGEYAVDVRRGRHGGIRVRRRWLGDGLAMYAERAWQRIKEAVSRTKRNVASLFPGPDQQPDGDVTSTYLYMDATFIEDRRIERDGARILAGEISIDEALAAPGRARARRSEADLADERVTAWALEVIAERVRLDREDPDWDLLLDQARERWIVDR